MKGGKDNHNCGGQRHRQSFRTVQKEPQQVEEMNLTHNQIRALNMKPKADQAYLLRYSKHNGGFKVIINRGGHWDMDVTGISANSMSLVSHKKTETH